MVRKNYTVPYLFQMLEKHIIYLFDQRHKKDEKDSLSFSFIIHPHSGLMQLQPLYAIAGKNSALFKRELVFHAPICVS
jgi:hypothetical protein